MAKEYDKRSGKCPDIRCQSNKKCAHGICALSFRDCRRQEITAKIPPPVAVDNASIEASRRNVGMADEDQKTGCTCVEDREGLYGRGLLHYKKWWKLCESDILVNGVMLTGIPIFTDKNTLRVVDGDHSYFIPLEKIDFIRTSHGLKTCSPSEYTPGRNMRE